MEMIFHDPCCCTCETKEIVDFLKMKLSHVRNMTAEAKPRSSCYIRVEFHFPPV